jgi:rhodanese-related sulfurtransferase
MEDRMTINGYDTMTLEALKERLDRADPDNTDPVEGFALVNVLAAEYFEKEHIPGSINIPAGNEDEFAKRFAADKEIIVYCASTDCDASPKVAKRLTERGFTEVHDFEAGMKAWKDANYSVKSARAA